MTNVRHSSDTPEWGSAASYVNVAHQTLNFTTGHAITVDPFSSAYFNTFVQAQVIGTHPGDPNERGFDGYSDPWYPGLPRADHILLDFWDERDANMIDVASFVWGENQPNSVTALVNPPGDDRGRGVKNAWYVLSTYYNLGWIGGGAVWVAFNLNQLQTLQPKRPKSKRAIAREAKRPWWAKANPPTWHGYRRCVPHNRQRFTPEAGRSATSPSHPSMIVLLPSPDPAVGAAQIEIFTRLGQQLGEVF